MTVTDPFERLRRERRGSSAGDDLSPRPPSASLTTLVQVMELAHVNNAGNVHGGEIMRMVDTAAGIAAFRHCRTRTVTASMEEMSFLEPVYIGDLVTLTASVNDAFRTSMDVGVRVDVESIPSGEKRHVASAHLVFVALDAEGRPAPVPPVAAQTDEEIRRQAEARIRRQQRLLRAEAVRRAHPARGAAG